MILRLYKQLENVANNEYGDIIENVEIIHSHAGRARKLRIELIDSFCTEISHRRPSLDQRFRILAFQMKRNLKKTLKQDSLHEFRHTDTVVSYFIVNV
ncbi:MAG: hypothetical protein D8M57_20225 [Candidatus Scalindua sp. AMX11]|nr:hypothetical protein [Planctomycetota bacterium]TDE63072.1 MAG: hypothetical protein D8M57_20225 [Candidatus Scalindua sp. AMX11]GJQ60592.1 MAG: hypothetical protein SCALA701_33930 [Candidatus Scalindua sp.]